MPPQAQIPLRRRQENDSRQVNREYSFRLFVLPLLNIKRHSNHRLKDMRKVRIRLALGRHTGGLGLSPASTATTVATAVSTATTSVATATATSAVIGPVAINAA